MCLSDQGQEGTWFKSWYQLCSVQVDECTSNPCQNDSICLDEINGYLTALLVSMCPVIAGVG